MSASTRAGRDASSRRTAPAPVPAGGSFVLTARAQPASGDAPTYLIETPISSSNETITVTKHGLTTGDTVEYDPNGHTPISGLEGPFNEDVLRVDDNGNE